MARLGVTYQDIANTADQLVGEGKQPTIELIRNQLGTGSTTTIANHLRKWRSEQDGSTAVASKENLPQEFVSVMKGLWQRLQAHADNQIVSVKQDAEQTVNQLRQEADKYKANNQRWQKMHETWIKEKDEWTREKLGLEQAITSLQKENTIFAAKSAAEEQRIDELNRLHTLTQENLEHFRESTRVQRLIEQEKQAQLLQQAELSLRNVEQQLVISNQDKLTLQTQIVKTSDENAALKISSDAANIKLHALESALTTLQREQGETKHDLKHSKLLHDISQKKNDEQSIVLVELQKHNAVMTQQLSMAYDDVKELKEMNKFLAREKWELAQEKAQLEGINQQLQKMIHLNEAV